MFQGKIFSKERSLLLFCRKLPDCYASRNGENFIVAVFILENALSVGTNLVNIRYSSGYSFAYSFLVKDGHKTHYPSRRTILCCASFKLHNRR